MLGRDWLRLLELGGNVYYTYKLAACDGMTFQDLAGRADRHDRGGLRPDDARRAADRPDGEPASRTGWDAADGPRSSAASAARTSPRSARPSTRARRRTRTGRRTSPRSSRPAPGWPRPSPTSASSSTTTTPPRSRSRSCPRSRSGWPTSSRRPTRATARARCRPCRATPTSPGTSPKSLILDEFDMTLVNEMPVDHGLTVPLSVLFGQPEAWPCRVVPAVRQRRAVPAADRSPVLPPRPGDPPRRRVLRRATSGSSSLGTGGMSHQLQAQRAGLINVEFDTAFLDGLVRRPGGRRRGSRTSSTCARPAPRASSW